MPAPREIREYVQEFCREIAPQGEPIYLAVTPSDQDALLDCFINVERTIAESGGDIQYGWRIWEWVNTLIEAEFHAVWRSPDGNLIDVTPAPHDYKRVLFLPDDGTVYEGRQVDNIRKALIQNPLVDEFIELWRDKFEIENRGDRANIHGVMELQGKDAARFDFIQRRIAIILRLLSQCPCGSFVRFYRCCGMVN